MTVDDLIRLLELMDRTKPVRITMGVYLDENITAPLEAVGDAGAYILLGD